MQNYPGKTAQLIVNKSVNEFSGLPREAAVTHVAEVLRWNDRVGLVSKRDAEAACERLLLESLEILNLARLETGAALRVADIGSGGGFPGLVWGYCEPSWTMLLIERRERKATFLEATARILRLENVEVFSGQVSDAARGPRRAGSTDLAVAIAVGRPRSIVAELEPMLAAGGRFITTCRADEDVAPRAGTAMSLKRVVNGRHGNYAEYHRVPEEDGDRARRPGRNGGNG
jgi:16S rRNA (guanine527-N7)-methyltransferase